MRKCENDLIEFGAAFVAELPGTLENITKKFKICVSANVNRNWQIIDADEVLLFSIFTFLFVD